MLIVITGPMFSGKTSMLFSLLHNYKFGGRSSAIFKPSNDDRYDKDAVSTHYGVGRAGYRINKDKSSEVYYVAKKIANLPQSETGKLLAPSVFGIDEAQFFEPEGLIWSVERMLYEPEGFLEPPIIIVNGLSQDSFGKPFGAMPHLLAIADDIIHLKAVCAADKRINMATRTFRKIDSKEQTVVGGVDIYEPRCFDCWKKSPDEIQVRL